MKVKYFGPQSAVRVGGFGQHKQGEIKEYPPEFAAELLRTSKKQHFEAIGEAPGPKEKKSDDKKK